MKEKPSLLKLFLYFLKIGLVTFGGGYAIIATLEKELVDEKHWITHEDMLNMVVIGESTPGPIAINLATFIGHKMYGFWGSFLCTLGFILPSFLIIVLISVAIDYIHNVPNVVKWMFKGIRAGVVVLIGNAAVKFFKKMDKKIITFLLFLMSFFVAFFTDLNVIYLLLIGGAVGIIYTMLVCFAKKKNFGVCNGEKGEFTGRNEKIATSSEDKTELTLVENASINDNFVTKNAINIQDEKTIITTKINDNIKDSLDVEKGKNETEKTDNLGNSLQDKNIDYSNYDVKDIDIQEEDSKVNCNSEKVIIQNDVDDDKGGNK